MFLILWWLCYVSPNVSQDEIDLNWEMKVLNPLIIILFSPVNSGGRSMISVMVHSNYVLQHGLSIRWQMTKVRLHI